MYTICTAGSYVSHDLARKNAKFTMKLSATRHAALGRCGESRRSNTLTIDTIPREVKLIYSVQCLQANSLYH